MAKMIRIPGCNRCWCCGCCCASDQSVKIASWVLLVIQILGLLGYLLFISFGDFFSIVGIIYCLLFIVAIICLLRGSKQLNTSSLKTFIKIAIIYLCLEVITLIYAYVTSGINIVTADNPKKIEEYRMEQIKAYDILMENSKNSGFIPNNNYLRQLEDDDYCINQIRIGSISYLIGSTIGCAIMANYFLSSIYYAEDLVETIEQEEGKN